MEWKSEIAMILTAERGDLLMQCHLIDGILIDFGMTEGKKEFDVVKEEEWYRS